jgi:hypothetical protein
MNEISWIFGALTLGKKMQLKDLLINKNEYIFNLI